ncbi:MAG: hypothetical protein CMJ88_00045 [Planctomycetes bacterium]|nr:hypothetical protein [Planctomycetota bacterium]
MTAEKIERLRRRADLVGRARRFFEARGVMEVDTPLLADGVVVEAHIDPIPCEVRVGAGAAVKRRLLTSPEGPMKRLLAQGSGPIYQFAHAFRDGEMGRRHAVEFTMLEWYRPGLDHIELMSEVEALVQELIPETGGARFDRVTYRELFREFASIDPFETSVGAIGERCAALGVDVPQGFGDGTVDDALDLILVSHIEPTLAAERPLFVHGYPPSQAALAQVRVPTDEQPATADRFELYLRGVELANGYHELIDADEQRHRFEEANRARVASGRAALPIDDALLDALRDGFPPCAGVALGFDRLLMLALGLDRIGDV